MTLKSGKTVAKKTEQCEDQLIIWFHDGRHEILEKVLLSLPARTMRKVRQVSPDWREMINFYLETSNPRIEKIRSMKLRQEWIDNEPQVEQVQLKHQDQEFKFEEVYDMVADDRHVAIAALASSSAWHRSKNCVFIIDAKSLKLVRGLDAENGGWLNGQAYTWMKLAMNDEYLTADLGCSKPHGTSFAHCDQPIWFRNENYRKSDQKFVNFIIPPSKSPMNQEPLITEDLRLKPSLSNTGFYFLINQYSNTEIQGARSDHFQFGGDGKFSRGESATFEKDTSDKSVEFQLLPGPRESFRALHIESGGRFEGFIEGCVSLLNENRNNVVWERKYPGHSPKLIGFNENHVVVVWTENQETVGEVEVLSLADGKVVANIDCRQHFTTVDGAQTNGDRLALGGDTPICVYDVIIWDLKSGLVILRCSDLVKCSKLSANFLLMKDKLLFVDGGPVYSANFWL